MTRNEANQEAKNIYYEWCKRKEEIIQKAKDDGTWVTGGLDGNAHLFVQLNKETQTKLEELNKQVEE